ncbi:MAG: hypothetical protein JNM10_12085 [Planctomycetia bacterium]|nr:hypothetical protein [Planctomycetia bacterium]
MDRPQWIVGGAVGVAVATLVVLSWIPTASPRPVPSAPAPMAASDVPASDPPAGVAAPPAVPAGRADDAGRDPASRSSDAASASTGTRAGHAGLSAAVTRAFDAAKAHGRPLLVVVAPTVEASKPARTGALTAVLGVGRPDVGLAFATVAEIVAAPRAALGDAIADGAHGSGPSPFAVLFETDGTTPATVVVPWDPALDAVGMRWWSLALGRAFRSSLEADAASGGPTEDEERAMAALDRLAAAVDAAVIGDRARRDRRHTQRTYVDDLLLDPAERRADPIGRLACADDAELPELRRVLTVGLRQSIPRWSGLAWKEDASRTPPFQVRDDAWCGTTIGVADEAERLRGLARDAARSVPVAPILVFDATTP